MDKEETPSGILVGGTDSGDLVVWNPVKILNGETEDAVLFQNEKHTGMQAVVLYVYIFAKVFSVAMFCTLILQDTQ